MFRASRSSFTVSAYQLMFPANLPLRALLSCASSSVWVRSSAATSKPMAFLKGRKVSRLMFFPLLPCGWLVSIFSSVVFIWQFLSWRPAQVTTSQQMKVEVKDGLAGSRSDIENRAVAVFNAAFARQLGRYQVQVADILGIFRLGTFDVHDVFFGNDE